MQLDTAAKMRLLEFVCSFAWTDLKVKQAERDLIMRAVGDRMIIAPPLVTTCAQIDEMMALIHTCLDATLAQLRSAGQHA